MNPANLWGDYQETRAFGSAHVGVTFSGATYIGSPIDANSLSLASDDEVINAFRTVPDSAGWSHPRHWLKGGNIQLSREFANFAKENPDRASRIIKRFESNFATRAAGYALDAMAETSDPSIVFDLIQTLHKNGFDGDEFRGSVASAIGRLARREIEINDEALGILEEWLDRAPASKYLNQEDDTPADSEDALSDEVDEESTDNSDPSSSVLWGMGVISILPSGNFTILDTLSHVYLSRSEHDRLLTLLRAHINRNDDSRAWQSLLTRLVYLSPTSLDNLTSFFLELFENYPKLKQTRQAAFLLAHVHRTIPDFVRVILQEWREAKMPMIQKAYGELVTLVAFVHPDFSWADSFLNEIIDDDKFIISRIGAAHSSVNMWIEPRFRSVASELLQRLIPKATKQTWAAIFDLFRLVDEITPEQDWISLLEIISEYIHTADGIGSSFVVERLQTLLPHQALLVARIAKGLIANWRGELGDIRTGIAADAPNLIDLALTLHRLGPTTRDVGTSIFEDLLEINAYSARQVLGEIDNRFPDSRRPVRRRLPRRANRRSQKSM